MRTVGPIDAGDGKTALGQYFRQVSDGAAYIQHPATFAVLGELGQEQRVTTIPGCFELIPGGSLGGCCHSPYYATLPRVNPLRIL